MTPAERKEKLKNLKEGALPESYDFGVRTPKLLDDWKSDEWEDPFDIPEAPTKPKLQQNQIESDGKVLTLNDGQFAALNLGRKFLNDEVEREVGNSGDFQTYRFATIAGSAGSGKTTIAKAVLANSYSVVVTAPTHKAKKVVSRATGYKGETIQKILGMRPNTNLEGFSNQNVLFDLSGKSLLDQYRIVLIDESSMLTADLVKLLKEKAKEHDIKIIFLGDPRQLPPVKEKLGTVFIDEDILQIRLTKVERQSVGNPLIGLYDKILNHIDKIDDAEAQLKLHNEGKVTLTQSKINVLTMCFDEIPFEFKSLVVDEVGFEFFSDKKAFGAEIMKGFKLGEDLDNRVLCWTNLQVAAYNFAIRRVLLGDGKLPLQVGEFLMAYNSVTDVNDWRHQLYENSADYIVKKVVKGYKPAADYDKRVCADIQGYYVTIQDTDENRGEEKIFFPSPESYNDYVKIEQIYAKFAETATNKKWAWKLYFDFKNQFAVMSDIRQAYSGYVKDISKVKIDFDFGYAISFHKAQGSTYNNVYVVDDFYNNPSPSERWRLGYVAMSRPRKMAYMLNSIAR